MQISINFVDITILQETLNQTFGENIFIVVVDKNTEPKSYYLEFADTTSQNLIDQAVTISNESATSLFNAIKINLYNKLQGKVDKAIIAKEKPVFSDSEIQQANDWLQNMSSQVPTCVIFLSLNLNISNQLAADNIANSKINYERYINQINAIKTNAQAQVLSSQNVYDAKNIATLAIAEIKSVT